MQFRSISCLLMALLATMALAACGQRSETYRYRMTVEVETPQGLRTGSSVIEVSLTQTGKDSWAPPEARGVNARILGEAVAVDLPDDRVLFALLRSEQNVDAAKWFAHWAIRTPDFSGEYGSVRTAEYMKEHRLSGVLPRTLPPAGHLPERSAYPMMVTFRDIDDPTSVALVDPDDLAATFGEGVRLRRITIEMTDDAVTTGIEKRLPGNFFKTWAAFNQELQSEIGLDAYFRTLLGQISRDDFVSE